MNLGQLFSLSLPGDAAQLWSSLHHSAERDEATMVAELLALQPLDEPQLAASEQLATTLIEACRNVTGKATLAQQILQQYRLDSPQGQLLMTLAEALPRIPDSATADALLRDRLQRGDWQSLPRPTNSLGVKAARWGLALSGRLLQTPGDGWSGQLNQLSQRLTAPLAQRAIRRAISLLGGQFVLGSDLAKAMAAARSQRRQQVSHSFDMLGEAAQTAADARRYADRYRQAIIALSAKPWDDGTPPPTVSLKLSALHPRYEQGQHQRVMSELGATLGELVSLARERGICLQLDAEECARHSLLLELFAVQLAGPAKGWGGLGLVVQAYAKWALPTLVWLADLGHRLQTTIPVRLVKGAYWDAEIKQAQALAISHYPLFTCKLHTDLNYLLCARYLLCQSAAAPLQPQFATHNGQTLASLLSLGGRRFEWQRLWGMGDELSSVVRSRYPELPQRIYAPVGDHRDLLPYLIRRLLENGANNAFVHQFLDPGLSPAHLARHPRRVIADTITTLPLPTTIFGQRLRAEGVELTLDSDRQRLLHQLGPWQRHQWRALPAGVTSATAQPRFSPQNPSDLVGEVTDSDFSGVQQALERASLANGRWASQSLAERALLLERLADQYQHHSAELVALCVREAGKTVANAIDEVREAIDFLRYYAQQAPLVLAPQQQPAITGESNELLLEPRGIFVCISPWNFPLAIFTGQIAAALVAGNTVIAKPAEQTPLIAARAVALMHEVGIPAEVVQLITGPGATIGAQLVSDRRTAGVCFTGSEATARAIATALLNRGGPLAPLIAETGGLNAMIVDSSALPEQVIRDLLRSAFDSAGQRCSACRILLVQEEIAERIKQGLLGAMAELTLGDPWQLSTDIGPVIDHQAQQRLDNHIRSISEVGKLLGWGPQPPAAGTFVSPALIELPDLQPLSDEVFGPVLHLIPYQRDQLPLHLAALRATGFGLTLGIHSRNPGFARQLAASLPVGNVYINRNQVGAEVEAQPFGGRGRSGTGPKAGGPNYLRQFVCEKTITTNLAAVGGNLDLLLNG